MMKTNTLRVYGSTRDPRAAFAHHNAGARGRALLDPAAAAVSFRSAFVALAA